MLNLYLYDKVWGSDNDLSSQLKGFYTTEKWTVERRLRSEKNMYFFSRICGVRILEYIAVTIHYEKIIDNRYAK